MGDEINSYSLMREERFQMGELNAYGSKVTSIFQLIGTLENDITKSIAWALCQTCCAFVIF